MSIVLCRCALIAPLALAAAAHAAIIDPALMSWRQNTTGATGTSTSPTVNAIVSQILADVQQVRYTATDAFINASGIPSYAIGPWPGNPNSPSNQNFLVRIPRTPTVNNNAKTATGLGVIGLLVNGVGIFNAKDAHSYNNANVWFQNAVVVEADGFDATLGHVAPGGTYHHHQHPVALQTQLHDDGSHFSPILGYAFDGYPIYGSYASTNTDGTGPIKRMASSYRLRNITSRTTLPDGSPAPSAGPDVSAQYPLGYYIEDYEYVPGLGDLDQYNGRFTVTPDYPNGTYAYFTTIDAQGNSAYPYTVGPSYYGNVAQDTLSHTVSVPAGASVFTVPEPAALSLLAPGGLLFFNARRRR